MAALEEAEERWTRRQVGAGLRCKVCMQQFHALFMQLSNGIVHEGLPGCSSVQRPAAATAWRKRATPGLVCMCVPLCLTRQPAALPMLPGLGGSAAGGCCCHQLQPRSAAAGGR